MGIEDSFTWYLKKFGTHDKEQWESCIEELMTTGFAHKPKRTTKPNTELIDVDFIRGSSLMKVKPQHGFITVAKLATLRCIFLPLFRKWWIEQTSGKLFFITLILYTLQLVNVVVYFIYRAHINSDRENVSCLELVIPFVMMWVLSYIHSQIAAAVPKQGKIVKIRPKYRRRFRNRPVKVNADDDGFESLNGNGSRTSEEESNLKLKPSQPGAQKRSSLSNSETGLSRVFPSKPAANGEDGESSRKIKVSEWVYDWISSDEESDCPIHDENAPRDLLMSANVCCVIWENNEVKKAELSMLDISSAIIAKVENKVIQSDSFYLGIILSTVIALHPIIFNFYRNDHFSSITIEQFFNYTQLVTVLPSEVLLSLTLSFGKTPWERLIIFNTLILRFALALNIFFLLAIAERTYEQRKEYAKMFSNMTSLSNARKNGIPHFRLNKVQNIKTWLSVRSYLRKRGPQRSVDLIVSTAFIVSVLLLSFLCIEFLKEETRNFNQYYLEALVWCFGLGIMLVNFITVGSKIHKKFSNLSVLITEQMNLQLLLEQKPHKKEALQLANNGLKLAIDLLKEVDSPFKISGFSANPILCNILKLVLLSALSGILSDCFGFKLKLEKLKLK